MTYKCLECGHIFEEGEQAVWYEDRGEFYGIHAREKISGCPLCYGSCEETTNCRICGSQHLADELYGGVCDECIDECRNNLEVCRKISKDDFQTVKINSLLASYFDEEKIEEILFNFIKEKYPKADFSEYINEDKAWFGERLAENEKQ